VLDGVQDALRDVGFLEDGEQKREARLHAREHAGVDVEGPHHGGLDPGGAALQLQAQRLVEAHGGELAGRVVGLARGADEARRRGHGDDVPAVARDHGGQKGLGRPEQRQGVDPEGALDELVRELQQRLAADDPGVVHEDVHRALGGQDLGGGGGDPLTVADVAGERAHRAGATDRGLGGGRLGAGLVQIQDGHGGAHLGASQHEAPADAGGAAGDEHVLVVDRRHGVPPSAVT
jgi:hypothetical protein